MERRTAIAVAVTSAVTMGTAAVTLGAVGAVNILGFSSAGSAGASAPLVVQQTEMVDKYVVLPSAADASMGVGTAAITSFAAASGGVAFAALLPAAATIMATPEGLTADAASLAPLVTLPGTSGPGTSGPVSTAATSTTTAPGTPAVVTTATTAAPVTTIKPASGSSTTITPTTATPTTIAVTTTTKPATTTTLPAGVRIPADWPASKPIPPIPAGCVAPQLEDNGVWNCQH